MLFQRVRKIGAAYQQAKRLRDIAGVLLKYGYDDLAQYLPLPRAARIPFKRVRDQQANMQEIGQPERLRRACEELGPTFVKLGQLAAARTRILPPEFTDELAKLQDQVAPLPFSAVRSVIEEELKRPLTDVFDSVEEAALGSASIGQVHRARLLTGEEVVIKVQRPGIQKTVGEDLAILRQLASLAETHLPEWRLHQPVRLVDELARSLEKEMDFTSEAAHLERFSRQFRDEAAIYLPAVFLEFTTPRVLVMEYVNGIKASKLDDLAAAGLDRRELGRRIADLVMKQIFAHGFFHADPHPGNLQIMPDQRVCFLDFGMMGFLDLRTREAFVDFVWGIARRSETSVATALLKLTESDLEPARGVFETDVAEFMHRHFYRADGEIHFGGLVSQLARLTGKHHLRLPPDLVVMLRALSLTEDLVRQLNPEHDLIGQAKPFMKQTRMERLRPRRVITSALEFAQEVGEVARELPNEVRRIVSQIKTGNARVNFRHEGLEPAVNAFERSTNRLSFALVVAALIISSSLIIRAKVPPMWGDVSLLGLAGYLLAGLMGFWLLISILRHGKM
ncbi:MAG TPA: AarF/ABC1/UbiB kinase family protein [Verrucomicrobiae bacterium]|nr:AarF/ABC1/UbiB kinase family protein [Verrucomicrobiae bacterium]